MRSWKESDRIPFAEMNGNDNVMKYFPATLSADESNAFVERIRAEFEETGFGLYAVEIKATGEFIGYVGFHRFSFNVPFSPNWEIGWRISDRFWHRGYATEAANACIGYARKNRLCVQYSFGECNETHRHDLRRQIHAPGFARRPLAERALVVFNSVIIQTVIDNTYIGAKY